MVAGRVTPRRVTCYLQVTIGNQSLVFCKLSGIFSPMTRSRHPDPRHVTRSSCPIAGALDVIGDRWTLLVVRDLFAGKRRYGEFQASTEGVPTNILADRLARLARAGLVDRVAYQKHPPRHDYRLTPAGEELRPVLGALAAWGLRRVAGTKADPKVLAALRG